MATYAIVHGAGDVGASWDLVAERLRARGHVVVAPDLPCEDDDAGFGDYADVVVEAIGDRAAGAGPRQGRDQLVVVAHSLGGFVAPRVCERVGVDLVVLASAMVPRPGESADQWWTATGVAEAQRAARAAGGWEGGEISEFLHDVSPERAQAALAAGRDQSGAPMAEPFPLAAWPAVPTRFLLFRDDRFFPAAWMREVVRDRLGIEPDEIPGSHAAYLSHPGQLAARLEVHRAALAAPPPIC